MLLTYTMKENNKHNNELINVSHWAVQAQFESLVQIVFLSFVFSLLSQTLRTILGFASWLFKTYICQLAFLYLQA